MYCNYCGKVIQDDASHCAYCGKRIGSVGGAPASDAPTSRPQDCGSLCRIARNTLISMSPWSGWCG